MRERKAFTLIEMLIVVSIIALLAMIAVGAYGSARQSAQIDLIADNLVSSLKYQQSLSKSGKVETVGEAGSKCYGMFFNKIVDDDSVQIQFIETPYYAVHPTRSEADVCELNEKTVRDFELDDQFELFMIDMYGTDQESDQLLIMFKPPFARIFVGDMNHVEVPARGVTPFIKFGIRLPNAENTKFFRFDSSTGLSERVYE